MPNDNAATPDTNDEQAKWESGAAPTCNKCGDTIDRDGFCPTCEPCPHDEHDHGICLSCGADRNDDLAGQAESLYEGDR